MPERPPALDYRSPPARTGVSEHAAPLLVAFLFALPRLACWFVLLGSGLLGRDPFTDAFAMMLRVAQVTAGASLVYYVFRGRERGRWYAVACIVCNVAGLLISLLALGFIWS